MWTRSSARRKPGSRSPERCEPSAPSARPCRPKNMATYPCRIRYLLRVFRPIQSVGKSGTSGTRTYPAGLESEMMTEFAAPLPILARYAVMVDVGYIYAAAGELLFGSSSRPHFRVDAAQAFGVRVHLWGIEPPYGTNQAERLVWESDTVDVLDAAFLRPYFSKNPAAVEQARSDAAMTSSPVPSPAQLFGERHVRVQASQS